jgi:hypothetical protein
MWAVVLLFAVATLIIAIENWQEERCRRKTPRINAGSLPQPPSDPSAYNEKSSYFTSRGWSNPAPRHGS